MTSLQPCYILLCDCAGWSVFELCQEDQPSQHAVIAEGLSIWHAPCEHGKTGETLCPAVLSCTLGSASVAVGNLAATLWLGMRMSSCTC